VPKDYLVTYVEDGRVMGKRIGEIFYFQQEAIEFAKRLRASRPIEFLNAVEVYEGNHGVFDEYVKRHATLAALSGRKIFSI